MVSNIALNLTRSSQNTLYCYTQFLSPKLLRSNLGYLMMIIRRILRFRLLKMECPVALQVLS